MKFIMIILLTMGLSSGVRAQVPVAAIISEGISRVIKAIDLQVQRFQTATVWMQDAQRVLENAMQELHLDEIRDWVQAQKDLYSNYFDELRKVKTIIADYERVKEIVAMQAQLLKIYKQAWGLLQQDQHFTAEELAHMGAVYAGILNESLKELDQLTTVISSFTTQMSDEDRLQIIDRTGEEMDVNYGHLLQFNNQNELLSLQRARDAEDIGMVKKLYGLP